MHVSLKRQFICRKSLNTFKFWKKIAILCPYFISGSESLQEFAQAMTIRGFFLLYWAFLVCFSKLPCLMHCRMFVNLLFLIEWELDGTGTFITVWGWWRSVAENFDLQTSVGGASECLEKQSELWKYIWKIYGTFKSFQVGPVKRVWHALWTGYSSKFYLITFLNTNQTKLRSVSWSE